MKLCARGFRAAAAPASVTSIAPIAKAHRAALCRQARGFTLIELMIVVLLIAVASSIASLALRDPASTMLEREGARLAALLEAARAEARASGLAAYWEPQTQSAETAGFRFVGLPPSDELPTRWLESGTSAEVVGARAVTLGPEPLIGAQSIVLRLRDQRLILATDGLGPFVVVADSEPVSR
ncbi:MAG: prepilin-type N-terminal cleavage/methylation domain-containing protein [Caldimonas sp.]